MKVISQSRLNKAAFMLGLERVLGDKEKITKAEMSLMDRISEAVMGGLGINPDRARACYSLGEKVGRDDALTAREVNHVDRLWER